MSVEIKKLGTRELWEQFQRNPVDVYKQTVRRMADAGIEETPTLSRVLEEISPSSKDDNLDAFERLLVEAGICVRSDPAAGYWASRGDSFDQNAGTRALFTEFFARNWRKVSHSLSDSNQRAALLSGDAAIGSWARPWAEAAVARPDRRIEPAIPLSELVALTTPVDNDSYRSWYMEYDGEQLRKFRVGESADIPLATIKGREHNVRLRKYGRGLRISYEDMRRTRVDKLAFYIQWTAVQSETDKVAAALDILINGDGNANTAAQEIDITSLDNTASNDTLTLKAWLAYKMQFEQPYVLTTVLSKADIALQIAMLNTGSANIPLIAANLGGLGTGATPINRFSDDVRYGWISSAPTGKIVGFDNRFALERVTEIGAEISEMERYVTNQTQVLVMTEIEGYGIIDPNATKILDVTMDA